MIISQQKLTPTLFDLANGVFKQKEKSFKKYVPLSNLYWVGSGREALRQILSQLDVETVAIPSFTCHVVLDAVKRSGKKAVFYDSGIVADVSEIKKIIKKVDVLILSYNFGFLPKIDKIVNLCRENKVVLIEDCAQALGAHYNGGLVGSFGDYAFYSFGISKNIGFCGGLISSKKSLKLIKPDKYPFMQIINLMLKTIISPIFFHPSLYSFTRKLLRSELDKKHPPLNYQQSRYAKNIVLHQLKRYGRIKSIRRRNAEYCMEQLEGVVDFVKPLSESEPSWLYFTILVDNRNQFINMLLNQGVELGEMKTFNSLDNSLKSLKTEKQHLTFALYRNSQDIKRIVFAIKKVQKDKIK